MRLRKATDTKGLAPTTGMLCASPFLEHSECLPKIGLLETSQMIFALRKNHCSDELPLAVQIP